MIHLCRRHLPKPWSELLFASLVLVVLAQTGDSESAPNPTSTSSTLSAATKLNDLLEQVQKVENTLHLPDQAAAQVHQIELAGVNSSQLTAVRSQLRARGSAELQEVVKSRKEPQTADHILDAFARAANSGVPEAERGAAWVAVLGEVDSLLKAATTAAANTSRSEQTIMHLGDAMFLGHKFGLHGSEAANNMRAAQEVYQRLLEEGFQAEDVNFTMVAMRGAGKAQVRHTQEVKSWAEAAENVRNAAAAPQKFPLPELMDVLNYAGEVGFPQTAEFIAVKANAQRQALQELRTRSDDGRILTELDATERLLANARLAGVSANETLLSTVEAKMRAQVAVELKDAMALTRIGDNVAKMKESLARAERTGVPDNQAWAGLVAEVEAALVAATRSANASWNEQTITRLADAINLGQEVKLPVGKGTDNMTIARALFTAQLQSCFQRQDVNLTRSAIRMAGKANVVYSQEIKRWAEVADLIEGAAEAPNKKPVWDLRNMIDYAVEESYPNTRALQAVKESVQERTAQELREAWASQGNTSDLDVMLPLLQLAKSANVSRSELAVVEKSLQEQVVSELQKSMALPLEPLNVVTMKDSLRHCERADIPEADRSAAWAKLQGAAQDKLFKALTAARSNWSVQTIEKLADSIDVGHQFSLPTGGSNNITVAKQFYQQQMEIGFQNFNEDATLYAVRMAPKASAVYSQEVKRYAEATENIRNVARNPQGQNLPVLLDILNYAQEVELPSSPDLITVQDLAKRLATEELKQVLAAGELVGQLRRALDDAVRAGVPERELASARQVLARSDL